MRSRLRTLCPLDKRYGIACRPAFPLPPVNTILFPPVVIVMLRLLVNWFGVVKAAFRSDCDTLQNMDLTQLYINTGKNTSHLDHKVFIHYFLRLLFNRRQMLSVDLPVKATSFPHILPSLLTSQTRETQAVHQINFCSPQTKVSTAVIDNERTNGREDPCCCTQRTPARRLLISHTPTT